MNQYSISQVRSLLGRLAIVFTLVGLFLGSAGTTAAQESNPFADTGLPEIAVTVTDTAYEGVPTELTAGRYVLSLTNTATTPNPFVPPFLDFLGAAFVKVPAEYTSADFLAMLAAEQAAVMASPEAALQGEPDWLYETVSTGGPYAYRGMTTSAVIDLTAGDWILWGENILAGQAPIPVKVTGEAPADQATPTATLTIEATEFSFTNNAVAAGPQIIELRNIGQQPHFLALAQVPDGTTLEEFMVFAAGSVDPSATPAALSPEDVTIVVNTADQSSAVTAWYAADLGPGTYVAICFVTDPATGAPHAMLGMAHVFAVA